MKDHYPEGFQEHLTATFHYDATKGELLRRSQPKKGPQTMGPVKTKHPTGFIIATISFNGKQYLLPAARVCFFLHHRRWPSKLLFKDDNKENLKIDNLVEEKEYTKLNVRPDLPMVKVELGLKQTPAVVVKNPKGRPPSPETVEKRTLAHATFSGDEAIRNMQLAQQENQELLREMKKYEDAVPFFGELDKLNAALYEEEKRTRWSQGCYTGMTRYELMTFFEEANTHSEAVYTRREAAKMYVQAVESGQLSSLEKFDHDRLQAGAWLDLLDRGIMSGTDIDERLAEYTWEGKIVRDACKVRKEAKVRELLAKHGFSSYEEAQKKAHDIFVAEQRKRQEEEARLLRQEEREAS